MPKVAIAGGSSPTLGASILAALSTTPWTPIILSRQTNNPKPSPPGIETRYVDYTSHTSLVAALQDVNTVLSVVLIPGPESITYQLNLLNAAIDAGCRRFAPSEFALCEQAQAQVDLLRPKNVVWEAVRAKVEEGLIDAARFPCGMFMNYLGIGIGGEKEKEARAGLAEGASLVHLDAEPAYVVVPVKQDGSSPALTLTDIRDVGRFVVAALEMEEWGGRELGMAGDTLGFDELVRLCEVYTGKKVDVRRVTRQQLEDRLKEIPDEDVIKRMDCQIAMACAREGSVVPGVLNEVCKFQPVKVEEFLQRHWRS
ncbi:aromatic alcohol reductase [Aspergillus thermomutatus]|uniref:NmrA-like domain-containing protein n=1 Tax=Aspergillus thermomutatus TaxID=41047 RepID=A0A397FXG7_ASPTH|nr:uncharacterized protein CDV56_100391 [Aspergillus thermomutatus]RHZ43227.1 hypothetical protein CDV56_100391 [Aspergillus thermomutatus]